MGFKFNCPHCNQSLEAEEEWIGMKAECRKCGKSITISKSDSDKSKCPSCARPIDKDAVICINCGYHFQLGRKIEKNIDKTIVFPIFDISKQFIFALPLLLALLLFGLFFGLSLIGVAFPMTTYHVIGFSIAMIMAPFWAAQGAFFISKCREENKFFVLSGIFTLIILSELLIGIPLIILAVKKRISWPTLFHKLSIIAIGGILPAMLAALLGAFIGDADFRTDMMATTKSHSPVSAQVNLIVFCCAVVGFVSGLLVSLSSPRSEDE